MGEGNEVKRKLHLLKWEVICKQKKKGGLGLDFLQFKNADLLSKWWYIWFQDINRPWRDLVQGKYALKGELNFEQCWGMEHKLSLLLNNIVSPVRDCRNNEWISKFSTNAYKWITGNGLKALFWEDLWYGNQTLMSKFPRLYCLSSWKHLVIAEFIERWNSEERRCQRWSRPLRVWEKEKEEELQVIISGTTLLDRQDRVS